MILLVDDEMLSNVIRGEDRAKGWALDRTIYTTGY